MTPQGTLDNSTLKETKRRPKISSPYIADWEHRGFCLQHNKRRNNDQIIPHNAKLIYYWQEDNSFPKNSRYSDLCSQPIGRSCELTFDGSKQAKADAVIFHASRISRTKPPFRKRRGQVWVARALESPPHWLKGYASPAWRGVINWTMTYRTDSDIFAPIRRLV